MGTIGVFHSPMFIAIVIGLLWSFSSLGTKGVLLTPLFEATHIVAKANTFSVVLSKQYGCNAKLATQLVFVTLCGSLFTVALMMNL